MNALKIKISLFVACCFALVSTKLLAQQGDVSINQNDNIYALLNLKKELNEDENTSDRYKILIFQGKESKAEDAKLKFKKIFPQYTPTINFEYPNYKVYVGNYRTKIEAERARVVIKEKFPNASPPIKPRKDK